MLRGTVKWFNDARGYGFIARENGNEVYVHHTVIEGSGYRTLQEGEEVEYEERQGERGLEAAHVVKVCSTRRHGATRPDGSTFVGSRFRRRPAPDRKGPCSERC